MRFLESGGIASRNVRESNLGPTPTWLRLGVN